MDMEQYIDEIGNHAKMMQNYTTRGVINWLV